MIGLSLCTLFYETAKSCVGSLRPHFFAVCRPSIDLKNCTSKYTYITDYNCTAPENDLLIDSRQATPWSDILYSVVEKVKVIPLVHVIYTAILAHMTLYVRSQGGFKVVGAQLGAGSRRSLRYILSLLGRTACLVVMSLF